MILRFARSIGFFLSFSFKMFRSPIVSESLFFEIRGGLQENGRARDPQQRVKIFERNTVGNFRVDARVDELESDDCP